MRLETTMRTSLLILCLLFSIKGFPQNADTSTVITIEQLRSTILMADSLDECRETADSLQVQIAAALSVISADSTLISNLRSLSFNQGEIISGKDLLLINEKHISSSLRNKYRLWKIAAIVLGGLTVYQSVK